MTIDKATVEHCIALLRGSGVYERKWPEPLETWTFTTHPMDLLAPLIAPEPTEAEKLVNEWLGGCADENDTDYVRLAQFILDKQRRDNPAKYFGPPNSLTAYTVDHQSFDAVVKHLAIPVAPSTDINAALGNCEPQYVFGPWIEWQGGECPVPGDWMVDIVCRYETVEDYAQTVACATSWRWDVGPCKSDITHYRVRFEVGKWYDWAGGPCPVGPDVEVVVVTRNGEEGVERRARRAQEWSEGLYDWWKHEGHDPDDNITRFKVTSA